MKRIFAYTGIVLLIFSFCCKPETGIRKSKHFSPPVSFERATLWADSILALMTIEEKVSFIGGDRIFFTQAIPRLNIPPVMMADATQGVHLRDQFHDGEYLYERALPRSTAFPCPILLASTWNRELAGEYARAIGEECRAGGIAVLLGPGMNIYRHAQCGRNFEYFGEDPYLAGQMIENYVVALQSMGTIATLKHFLANNTDYYRRKSNSVVDERTLHEIYLPAFRSGIDAGAMAVMTSYNQLNGEWCGQSEYVIDYLLRNQLGFKWLVMTDWWSVYDGSKVIESGMDLEMPYRVATENALDLIRKGKVLQEDIDRMVRNILRTLYAMNAFHRHKEEIDQDLFEKHEQIALQTAREGIVLLRNEARILPVEDTAKRILIMGDYAYQIPQGGGAAAVEGYDHITLADAMGKIFGKKATFENIPSDETIKHTDIVVLIIGTFDSEGWDKPFELPDETEAEIKRITGLNRNLVVVVNSGSGIQMTGWYMDVAAILYAWYPGQNGAMAIAEIIAGKVNPSGKLPITIEKEFMDSPGYGYLPNGEELYSGWHNQEEKLVPVYDVHYREGVFVGYRWYDRQIIPPLYPFGFGLSYTSFEIKKVKLSSHQFNENDTLLVTIYIKNTGERKGAETIQLYISDPQSSLARPVKELKGFEKVELKPGETKKVTIPLDIPDFSFWDPESKGWKAEPGEFEILVGTSSDQLHKRETIILL